MRSTILAFYVPLLLLLFAACNGSKSEVAPVPEYDPNDPESIAGAMLTALGGDSAWANTSSLYIRTQQQEEGIEKPYVSEIWRDLNSFKLRIEQQNDDFHTIGFFSQGGGWIERVDQDTVQEIGSTELVGWWLNHERNFYRVLHRLASKDQELQLKAPQAGRLDCYEGDTQLCSFILDENARPSTFIIYPLDSDSPQTFHYSSWSTTEGMLHPSAGSPADSSFFFETLVWEPHSAIFEAAFEIPYSRGE